MTHQLKGYYIDISLAKQTKINDVEGTLWIQMHSESSYMRKKHEN